MDPTPNNTTAGLPETSPWGAQNNLELDRSLFQSLEAREEAQTLRMWESPVAVVVLGRSGVIARDVVEDACVADGVAILRRDSGGGAVLLGPGCLNYSLLLSLGRHPELRDVRASYGLILGCLIQALAIPGLEIRGLSDLAIRGRKVSGNAQRRGYRALVHHGTLLYALDPGLAKKYLKEPLRQPDYRQNRRHVEFLCNLPLGAGEIKKRMALVPYLLSPNG